MEPRGNKIIRKIVYFILFAILILGFVYLGEKYKDNSKVKVYTIEDYYPGIGTDIFQSVSGSKLISILKDKNSHLILVGSSKSVYSQKYIIEIKNIVEELKVDKVIYYDSYSDKSQKNSNYYEIRKLLEGYLTVTDGSEKNLLAPSFYIIKNGEVVYYNTETSAMKNTDNPDKYWTEEKEIEFSSEITSAINKYYINK
ncbi:MAG: hypothetical protein II625_00990 [Bacilli bacterium]|nr:hypothetical protein [Bacilli bacterium]